MKNPRQDEQDGPGYHRYQRIIEQKQRALRRLTAYHQDYLGLVAVSIDGIRTYGSGLIVTHMTRSNNKERHWVAVLSAEYEIYSVVNV
jgi:hypothetical protein